MKMRTGRNRTREIIDQCIRCVEFSAGARARVPRGRVRAHVDAPTSGDHISLPHSRSEWSQCNTHQSNSNRRLRYMRIHEGVGVYMSEPMPRVVGDRKDFLTCDLYRSRIAPNDGHLPRHGKSRQLGWSLSSPVLVSGPMLSPTH